MAFPKATAATATPIEKVTTVVFVKRSGKVTTTPRNPRDIDPTETTVTVAAREMATTPQDVDPTVTVPETIVITIATTEDVTTIAMTAEVITMATTDDVITIATTEDVTTTVRNDRNVDATVTAVTVATTGVTTTVWDHA